MASLGDILSAAATGHSQGEVNMAYAMRDAQLQDVQAQIPLRSAQTEAALAEAQQHRNEAIAAQRKQDALDHFTANEIANGRDPAEARTLGDVLTAGGNFEQAASGMGHLQTNHFRDTLADPNATPDARLLAQSGIEGKVASPYVPLPLVSTDVRNPQPVGKAPKALISPLGDATIDNKNANTDATKAKTALAANGQFSESRAQLIAAGKAPYPTNYEFTRSPAEAKALSDRVMELNPNFSSTDLPLSQQTMAYFNKGVGAQRVTAVNASSQHLQTMRDLISALHNGDTQAFNAAANYFAAQTGDSAPTNLAEAGQFVGTELMKALTVSGAGSAAERDKLSNDFANARSEKQLNDAAATAEHLLNGQAIALEKQYRGGGGKGDFRSMKLLPETRQALGLNDPSPTDDAAPTPGAHAVAGAVAPAAATLDQTPPPPAVVAQLKEGFVQPFQNGQAWTLKNGKPVRVK